MLRRSVIIGSTVIFVHVSGVARVLCHRFVLWKASHTYFTCDVVTTFPQLLRTILGSAIGLEEALCIPP